MSFTPSSNSLPANRYWLGIGCQRGIEATSIAAAIDVVATQFALAISEIVGLATIDFKADEAGLIRYARQQDLPIKFFAASDLARVIIPHPIPHLLAARDIPSVAEASAILASGRDTFIVTKQIYHCPNTGRYITLAIA
jgi:cobalamin biosynthesis protein CbiG